MFAESNQIEKRLKKVQAAMADSLRDTNVSKLLPANKNLLGNGKMLRSRLVLSMGAANKISEDTLISAAAAVDIIHAASLLHDDVIDGGILRRGAPTFWKKYGVNGAILFGDLLMFKALALLVKVDRPDLLQELIDRTGDVCRSEVEQELILRGTPGDWNDCMEVARFKTGSLFAFAAVAAAADEPGQADALREAGYILGTAYQLTDDLLDATGNEAVSGKTLGTDDQRGKTTAISASKNAPKNPVDYIYSLLDTSSDHLKAYPDVQKAWDDFLNVTMKPVLSKHLGSK
ncbi:MAG: polyprenyl synthetase family protein [Pontiella sp.]|nr:polyprenyl synthetase family protein [Pontiella sp.]MBT8045861.1 polyprenyl synthetase family protein [Pontiella sp.]NNJ70664.1 polyprenyl synthetase family protein [Kiritimatiellales bacterium]